MRDAPPQVNYEGGVGPTTFDEHDQARLPMTLRNGADGKPVIKGAFHVDIDDPKPRRRGR